MATVSIRVDDSVKAAADSLADSIGLPLSTAINIFLKRFVTERGFPFSVTAGADATVSAVQDKGAFDRHFLESRMQAAVQEANKDSGLTPTDSFSYIDPQTKSPVTIYRRKE